MEQRDLSVRFECHGGIWIAWLRTRYGDLEVLLDGNEREPSPAQMQAFGRFLESFDETIRRLWGRLSPRWLFRPIRVSVSMQNIVGVQFQNRITGKRVLVDMGE